MTERCKHDMLREFCDMCSEPPSGINRLVYFTSASQVFHNRRDCELLISGQNFAVNIMNLNKRPIEQKHWSEGASSRGACSWCCAEYHANKKPAVFMLVRQGGTWRRMRFLTARDVGNGRFQYQMKDPESGEVFHTMNHLVKKLN